MSSPIEIVETLPRPDVRPAEHALLGAVLIAPNGLARAAGLVSADDFGSIQARTVWQALQALDARGQPTNDLVVLRDELARRGQLDDVGGPSAIARLVDGAMVAHTEAYAVEIRDAAIRRRALRACVDLATRVSTDHLTPVADLLASGEQAFRALELTGVESAHTLDGRALAAQIQADFDDADAGKVPGGLQTGFTHFDRVTTGLQPGELCVIAGRPGMGKTSFALAVAWHIVLQGGTVGVASLEMSASQLTRRLLSLDAGVPYHQLAQWATLGAHTRKRVTDALWHVQHGGLLVNDRARTVTHLRSLTRAIQHQKGRLDLLVVDYLQRMHSDSRASAESRVREVGEWTSALKTLAQDRGIPVLLLAQVNRQCETRSDKRPLLSDLRDSGEIEQDADLVAFLYRESHDATTGELILAKQRNGECGTIPLAWDGPTMRYSTLGV